MMDIWVALAIEGNSDLIKLLHRVENNEPGFGTVIIPIIGFSFDDDIHNAVLDWLKRKGINVWSPGNEQACLEYALKGNVTHKKG